MHGAQITSGVCMQEYKAVHAFRAGGVQGWPKGGAGVKKGCSRGPAPFTAPRPPPHLRSTFSVGHIMPLTKLWSPHCVVMAPIPVRFQ